MVHEGRTLAGPGVVEVGLLAMWAEMDFLSERMDLMAPGRRAGGRTASGGAFGKLEKYLQTAGDNVEELKLWMKAEARWRKRTATVAQSPGPHVSMGATGAASVAATLSHRQTSCVIREETASLQANRVLRWRLTIGDCCADAKVRRKGATGWTWAWTAVFSDTRPLRA